MNLKQIRALGQVYQIVSVVMLRFCYKAEVPEVTSLLHLLPCCTWQCWLLAKQNQSHEPLPGGCFTCLSSSDVTALAPGLAKMTSKVKPAISTYLCSCAFNLAGPYHKVERFRNWKQLCVSSQMEVFVFQGCMGGRERHQVLNVHLCRSVCAHQQHRSSLLPLPPSPQGMDKT